MSARRGGREATRGRGRKGDRVVSGETASRADCQFRCRGVVRSALAGGLARAPAWSVQPAWEWTMDRTEITAASVFAPFVDEGAQHGGGRPEDLLVLGQPAGADIGWQAGAEEGDGLLDRAVAAGLVRGPRGPGQGALEVLQVGGQERVQAQALARTGDGVGGQTLLLQSLADGEEGDGPILEGGGNPQTEQGNQVSPGDGGGHLQSQVGQKLFVQMRAEATDALAVALKGTGAEEPQALERTERRGGAPWVGLAAAGGLDPDDAMGPEVRGNCRTRAVIAKSERELDA